MSIWAGTTEANAALDKLGRNVTSWRRFFYAGRFYPAPVRGAWLVIVVSHFKCK